MHLIASRFFCTSFRVQFFFHVVVAAAIHKTKILCDGKRATADPSSSIVSVPIQ